MLFVISCVPDEERMVKGNGVVLMFSGDTVFFDTIFSEIQSFDRKISICNPSNSIVEIDNIYLDDPDGNSPFRLLINGEESDELFPLAISGYDSITLVVDAAQIADGDKGENPFIFEDDIIVENNGTVQYLPIRAWGREAYYHKNDTIQQDELWSSDLPHVIYGALVVDANAKLTIDAGVQVHAAKNGFLNIAGSINVVGDSLSPVVFQGTEVVTSYSTPLGQWLGILFSKGSDNNRINGAVIQNSLYGLYINSGNLQGNIVPDVHVSNTTIKSIALSGIESHTSSVKLENVLITDCQQAMAAFFAGGTVEISHCTFSNYFSPFDHENGGFILTNIYRYGTDDGTVEIKSDLSAVIENSIINGRLGEEIIYEEVPEAGFEVVYRNNILDTRYVVDGDNHNIVLSNPKEKGALFLGLTASVENPYALDSLSPAIDKGLVLTIEKDMLGEKRDELPDIGAFEYLQKDIAEELLSHKP